MHVELGHKSHTSELTRGRFCFRVSTGGPRWAPLVSRASSGWLGAGKTKGSRGLSFSLHISGSMKPFDCGYIGDEVMCWNIHRSAHLMRIPPSFTFLCVHEAGHPICGLTLGSATRWCVPWRLPKVLKDLGNRAFSSVTSLKDWPGNAGLGGCWLVVTVLTPMSSHCRGTKSRCLQLARPKMTGPSDSAM